MVTVIVPRSAVAAAMEVAQRRSQKDPAIADGKAVDSAWFRTAPKMDKALRRNALRMEEEDAALTLHAARVHKAVLTFVRCDFFNVIPQTVFFTTMILGSWWWQALWYRFMWQGRAWGDRTV